MAFPSTGILDTFDRANEGPPPSASWGTEGVTDTACTLRVVSNELKDNGSAAGGYWGTSFGPDSESYYTVATLPANTESMNLYSRLVSPGGTGTDGYRIFYRRIDANPGMTIRYYRLDDVVSTQLGADIEDTSGAISAGIKLGFEMIGSTLAGYVNRSGSWVAVSEARTDSTYSAAGFIGIYLQSSTPSLDDFGGGTVVTGGGGLAWITA